MAGRVEIEVQKAIARSNGNKTLAQKELITAVLRDDELLRELVAPFLKPIAAQAIERAVHGSQPSRQSPGAAPLGASLSGTARAIAKDLRAGYNPMRAMSGNDPALGARPEASGRHVSTLKLLARVYEIKRGQQKV